MLEAGRPLNLQRDFKQHVWPYELARRGYSPGAQDLEWSVPGGGFSLEGEPYSCAEGSDFNWFRSRMVGGRTNQWGRGCYRFSESDFRGWSIDGAGEDWPITYLDLAEYYSKVERFIGVFGEDAPLSPPPPRCTELLVQKGGDKLGIPCRPARGAILTRPWNGRPACHYCGQCNRGCHTASNFSSSQVAIPAAFATGRLLLVAHAMVRELVVHHGRAGSATYINTITRQERESAPVRLCSPRALANPRACY